MALLIPQKVTSERDRIAKSLLGASPAAARVHILLPQETSEGQLTSSSRVPGLRGAGLSLSSTFLLFCLSVTVGREVTSPVGLGGKPHVFGDVTDVHVALWCHMQVHSSASSCMWAMRIFFSTPLTSVSPQSRPHWHGLRGTLSIRTCHPDLSSYHPCSASPFFVLHIRGIAQCLRTP